MKARAAAAHVVLRETPGVDRLELLAAVCWPLRSELVELPGTNVQRGPGRELGPAEREWIFLLAASGLSGYAIARQIGRPRSTVAEVLRRGSKASPLSRCD